jgi:single-strand DNA-binding protein
MNSVNLIGRLGDAPQLRFLPSSKAVCSFSIALSEKWKDQSGQTQERTSWVDVECFGAVAENVNKYVGKGDRVAVSGSIRQDTWEKDGQRRSKLKVIADRVGFIETRSDRDAAPGSPRQQDSPRSSWPASSAPP